VRVCDAWLSMTRTKLVSSVAIAAALPTR
jgi:hypothetical protein